VPSGSAMASTHFQDMATMMVNGHPAMIHRALFTLMVLNFEIEKNNIAEELGICLEERISEMSLLCYDYVLITNKFYLPNLF
jgi:hypothetical protein